MRIERLLADLEAAATARERVESRAEVADAVRVESARVTVADRLRAGIGSEVALGVDGEVIAGRLLDVGDGWAAVSRVPGVRPAQATDDLVRPGTRLVSLPAITSVSGLGRSHLADEGPAAGRGWSSVLRAVAQARAPIAWRCRGGESHAGLIDAVGADHVVLAVEATGRLTRIVTLAELAWIDVAPSRG